MGFNKEWVPTFKPLNKALFFDECNLYVWQSPGQWKECFEFQAEKAHVNE